MEQRGSRPRSTTKYSKEWRSKSPPRMRPASPSPKPSPEKLEEQQKTLKMAAERGKTISEKNELSYPIKALNGSNLQSQNYFDGLNRVQPVPELSINEELNSILGRTKGAVTAIPENNELSYRGKAPNGSNLPLVPERSINDELNNILGRTKNKGNIAAQQFKMNSGKNNSKKTNSFTPVQSAVNNILQATKISNSSGNLSNNSSNNSFTPVQSAVNNILQATQISNSSSKNGISSASEMNNRPTGEVVIPGYGETNLSRQNRSMSSNAGQAANAGAIAMGANIEAARLAETTANVLVGNGVNPVAAAVASAIAGTNGQPSQSIGQAITNANRPLVLGNSVVANAAEIAANIPTNGSLFTVTPAPVNQPPMPGGIPMTPMPMEGEYSITIPAKTIQLPVGGYMIFVDCNNATYRIVDLATGEVTEVNTTTGTSKRIDFSALSQSAQTKAKAAMDKMGAMLAEAAKAMAAGAALPVVAAIMAGQKVANGAAYAAKYTGAVAGMAGTAARNVSLKAVGAVKTAGQKAKEALEAGGVKVSAFVASTATETADYFKASSSGSPASQIAATNKQIKTMIERIFKLAQRIEGMVKGSNVKKTSTIASSILPLLDDLKESVTEMMATRRELARKILETAAEPLASVNTMNNAAMDPYDKVIKLLRIYLKEVNTRALAKLDASVKEEVDFNKKLDEAYRKFREVTTMVNEPAAKIKLNEAIKDLYMATRTNLQALRNTTRNRFTGMTAKNPSQLYRTNAQKAANNASAKKPGMFNKIRSGFNTFTRKIGLKKNQPVNARLRESSGVTPRNGTTRQGSVANKTYYGTSTNSSVNLSRDPVLNQRKAFRANVNAAVSGLPQSVRVNNNIPIGQVFNGRNINSPVGSRPSVTGNFANPTTFAMNNPITLRSRLARPAANPRSRKNYRKNYRKNRSSRRS